MLNGPQEFTDGPIVRGSTIDGHGRSAGDARNLLQIIELEVVARDGSIRAAKNQSSCP